MKNTLMLILTTLALIVALVGCGKIEEPVADKSEGIKEQALACLEIETNEADIYKLAEGQWLLVVGERGWIVYEQADGVEIGEEVKITRATGRDIFGGEDNA